MSTKGLYQDVANRITEGACGPLKIHADKSKTTEKEAQKHLRQCNGETPTETITANCWTLGFEDVPDVVIETIGSGSMMQEVFLVYAKHFVSSIPCGHGPVILFLDGHGSHWNRNALKFLMDNKVFLFFLASRTSIWSQSNDAGVNKRFHWAIKQSCKKHQCTIDVPTIPYFNTNILNGWREFP